MDAELDLPQLRQLVRSGQVGPDDEAAPVGEPLKPVRSQPALKPPPVRVATQSKRVARPRKVSPLAWMAAALIVVLGASAAFVVVFMPELFEKQTDAGINPLRRATPTWEKQLGGVRGTAAQHLATARAHMHMDTAEGHRKADDELRQALIADVGHVGAMAAWVENFASLPAARADLEGKALAQETIAYAQRRDPDSGDVKRALGALQLAFGEIDAAQRTLTEAQRIAPNAGTLLVLAASNLDRAPADALALVQQVRSQDATLKHALVVEGAAQRRLGEFAAAVEALSTRLADDPTNTGALKELALLKFDIGDPSGAIDALTKSLGAESRDIDAHLLRAKIAYQVIETPGSLARADGYLDDVIKNHGSAAGELLLPALSHAAYVKAELGNLDEAQQLAERARAIDGNFAPALFVLGRVYALKGLYPDATRALEQALRAAQARDTFSEPIARAELARVQVLGGDAAAAIRNYEQVIEYDPRYTRAHFGLAAAYMETGRATQAMTIMRRAFEHDPAYDADRRALTDYPTPARDLLSFANAFKNARVPPSDESLGALKLAAEAMIRYRAGEKDAAMTLARRALADDRFNLFALLYLSVIELESGRSADARKHLRLAVDTTGTQHVMMRLYLARAETATGDLDSAKKRLEDLIDQEPTLVQASYSLAMLMREQKLAPQARAELKKVILKDPDYVPAKRALADGI
jgi:tetratricopeptide (TPR) repeat protein